jgi:hypothetical protein
MTKQAIVVTTEGEMSVIDIAGDELTTLQSKVGGWVQAIDITSSLTMWANEEGKLVGLPVNGFATELWESRFGATDIIVGDIVLTGVADDEGETLGLSDTQVESIKALFA